MTETVYNCKYGDKISFDKGYTSICGKLRIKYFIKNIMPKDTDVILEIGCNKGDISKELMKKTDNVYGIDINREMINKIASKNFLYMSAMDLKFPDASFNKVCSFEVLEHIPDIKKVFKEVYRVLALDGIFIFSFPMELIRGQNAVFDSLLVYKHPFMARKLHIHKLNPNKIKELIQDIPFELIEKKVLFLPFPLYLMILKKSS
jgi:ubiquinone/menaquinone biosynthesis C-methylase UbiE